MSSRPKPPSPPPPVLDGLADLLVAALADAVAARLDALWRAERAQCVAGAPPPAPPPDGRWLTPRDAARHLGVAVKTLEGWRAARSGPAFAKVGARVRYALADLDAWARASAKPCR